MEFRVGDTVTLLAPSSHESFQKWEGFPAKVDWIFQDHDYLGLIPLKDRPDKARRALFTWHKEFVRSMGPTPEEMNLEEI